MIWLLYGFVALAGVWAVWYASRPTPNPVPQSRELMVEHLARAFHEEGAEWQDAYANAVFVVDSILLDFDVDEAEL